MKKIIVIPIFKELPSNLEILSINQCLKVLSKHEITFIHPKKLKLDFYKKVFKNVNYHSFADNYFESIEGYNKLMLSNHMYQRFIDFEYLLIYQNDCYVFKDELDFWCSKNYDYVGGVWFDDYTGNPNKGAKEWQAGNGGFSLRKIKTFLLILNSNKNLRNFSQLLEYKKQKCKHKPLKYLKEIIILPLNLIGFRNTVKFYLEKTKLNEDAFITSLSVNFNLLIMPDVKDAIFFSWDRCHEYMKSKYLKHPFGIHGWNRNDFPYEGNFDFWKDKLIKK
jgi:hypothetical protein